MARMHHTNCTTLVFLYLNKRRKIFPESPDNNNNLLKNSFFILISAIKIRAEMINQSNNKETYHVSGECFFVRIFAVKPYVKPKHRDNMINAKIEKKFITNITSYIVFDLLVFHPLHFLSLFYMLLTLRQRRCCERW